MAFHSQEYNPLEVLLSRNAQWAADVVRTDPDFFERSAKGQSPRVLWIGCADSRVPETVITGAKPGDIFVHRNIANQFHPEDDNALAVLEYAVNFLHVQHVVVVGHSECGGAVACLGAAQNPAAGEDESIVTIPSLPAQAPLNKWLGRLTLLVKSLGLSTVPKAEALPIVVEQNVRQQVENVCNSATISNAWTSKKNVFVHGWVHELGTGRLRDLEVTRGPIAV